MIKKIILPLVGVALFIVAVGVLMQKTGFIPSSQKSPSPKAQSTITINNKTLNVDVVKTSEEREKGLSGRSTLDPNSGMVFIFDTKGPVPSFWMKGMLIPLDIIWIRDGKIIKIDKNVQIPAANTPDNKLKIYSPGKTINYVLEVNAGFSDTNLVKVGDSVTFSGI